MTRFLTVDGTLFRVRLVREGEAPKAGLVYVSEFGRIGFVALTATTLDGAPEGFAAATDAELGQWARLAPQLWLGRRL